VLHALFDLANKARLTTPLRARGNKASALLQSKNYGRKWADIHADLTTSPTSQSFAISDSLRLRTRPCCSDCGGSCFSCDSIYEPPPPLQSTPACSKGIPEQPDRGRVFLLAQYCSGVQLKYISAALCWQCSSIADIELDSRPAADVLYYDSDHKAIRKAKTPTRHPRSPAPLEAAATPTPFRFR